MHVFVGNAGRWSLATLTIMLLFAPTSLCAPRQIYIIQELMQEDWNAFNRNPTLWERIQGKSGPNPRFSYLRTTLAFSPTDNSRELRIDPIANTGERVSGLYVWEDNGRHASPASTYDTKPLKDGKYQVVTKWTIQNWENEAITDFRKLGQVLIDHGQYSELSNDINDLMRSLVARIGRVAEGSAWRYPGLTGTIDRGFTDYKQDNPAKFRGRLYGDLQVFYQSGGARYLSAMRPIDYRARIADSAAQAQRQRAAQLAAARAQPPAERYYDSAHVGEWVQQVTPENIEEVNRPLLGDSTDDDPCGATKRSLPTLDDQSSLYHGDHLFRRKQCTAAQQEQERISKLPTSSVEVRTGGRLTSAISFGSRALVAAGAIGAILLPVFVIMDFVAGDWQAVGWTLGSLAAGIATDALVGTALAGILVSGVAIAGPVGLFVGALVGLLFAIIPGLFKEVHYANTGNTTQIIQYAFFKDLNHTGNEKCNANLVKNGQTPNCTVTYGAGALAAIFEWPVSTAALFLIIHNEGYAMSIPDMAANFTVYDHSNPSANTNLTAYIDCGITTCYRPGYPEDYGRTPPASYSQGPCPPSRTYPCANPKFLFNNTLVTVPGLNKTANDVIQSINTGDCKIVSDPTEGQIIYPPTQSGTFNSSDATANSSSTFDIPSDPPVVANDTSNSTSNSTGIAASVNSTGTENGTVADNGLGSWIGPYFIADNGTVIPVGVDYSGFTANSTDSNTTSTSISNDTTSEPMGGLLDWQTLGGAPINSTGNPVFIGCGLPKEIDSQVLAPDYNYTAALLKDLTNSSTNGNPSAYVPPPAPIPFQVLDASNALCFTSSKSPSTSLCLPNGTFTSNYLGKFNTKSDQFDTITGSKGATLNLQLANVGGISGIDIPPKTAFAGNTTASNDLRVAMGDSVQQKSALSIRLPLVSTNATNSSSSTNSSLATNSSTTSGAKGMCIYSLPNFKGDVACLGLGGGNFSSALARKAASVSFFGPTGANNTGSSSSPGGPSGVVAWLYANAYADPQGTYISTNVADLSSIPLGANNGTFANVVVGAWIYDATASPS